MHKDLRHIIDIARRPYFALYVNNLKGAAYSSVVKLTAKVGESKEPVEYADRMSLQYRSIDEGDKWGEFFGSAWFHLTGIVEDDVVENVSDYVAILDLGGEGCVFNDEGVVQGITNVLGFPDKLQSIKGKKVVELSRIGIHDDNNIGIWVEAGNNGRNYCNVGAIRFNGAYVAKVRRDIIDYYYDFLSLLEWYALDKNKARKKELLRALHAAIDISGDFGENEIQSARETLRPFLSADKDGGEITVYAVGHAHLDLAWLWPIRESKRKAERTFSNALYNIGKRDDYVFGASQPQQFEWIKDKRPKLYEEIKEAVRNKRLELQGCMWVESDTNIPSGESLIRQIYYGKKFYRDEFGVDVDTMWLPDAFGFTGALPQIMKKSGVNNFSTIKLSWNTVNEFPYSSFVWKGIDGSAVTAHIPPEGDYCSYADPLAMKEIENRFKEKDISNVALMPYGIGDGGAGPGEYHINMITRLGGIDGLPKVKLASTKEFFEELNREMSEKDFPIHQGELYLEKHRGTYTTQAKVKRYNRIAERDMRCTEWLLTLAYLNGMEYPHSDIDAIYKELLLYMFHDILPGSSINRVYKECYERYPILLDKLKKMRDNAIKYLDSGSGRLYILNPSPFERYGAVTVDGNTYEYSARAYSSEELIRREDPCTQMRSDKSVMENDYIRVVFNNHGEIISYYDKKNQHEAVCKGKSFNILKVYTDRRMIPFDAWDIDPNYRKLPKRKMKLKSVKYYVHEGIAVREQEYRYNRSTLKETITLDIDNEYLKFSCKADWRETHKMLRAEFYPNDYSDKVKCDIQFGHIERATTENNSIEKAQFETVAHKWVALDGENHGFALINDSKYGHRVKNGLVSLNLLRSPVWPDKTADKGQHEFSFAVYSYKGKATDSELIRYGYEMNEPIILCSGIEVEPIAYIKNKAIVLESVFVNCDGNVVFRLYESHGKANTTYMHTHFEYTDAYESDMMTEKRLCDISEELSFEPFEVKTVVFVPKRNV